MSLVAVSQQPGDAAADFLLLFAVILLGPLLMKAARIPGIIGLLLGGYVIGPHGLDLISSGNQKHPELMSAIRFVANGMLCVSCRIAAIAVAAIAIAAIADAYRRARIHRVCQTRREAL